MGNELKRLIYLYDRLDIFLEHRRIEIGLRWIIVQMWFHKIAGIEYPNKSYQKKSADLVNDLMILLKRENKL